MNSYKKLQNGYKKVTNPIGLEKPISQKKETPLPIQKRKSLAKPDYLSMTLEEKSVQN